MAIHIGSIEIQDVRNIAQATINFGTAINFLNGANGSGKTSILESIYMLATGNSFRTKKVRKVIKNGQTSCRVTGEVYKADISQNIYTLGLENNLDTVRKIKICGTVVNCLGELAKILPLNLINNEAIQLIDGEAKLRRQFLDWNLFHVEHRFLAIWRNFSRVLQQRNSFLKQVKENRGKVDLVAMDFWQQKFIQAAVPIDAIRQKFLAAFTFTFAKIIHNFLPAINLELKYLPGWPAQQSLEEALVFSRSQEYRLGITRVGPQRADISFVVGDRLAKDLLSRGQKKLVLLALLIARAVHMQEYYQQQCVFLIDDIQAELDINSCEKFMQALLNTKCQAIITGVETNVVAKMVPLELCSMFHVEHGMIQGIQK